jgi:hypothetical protein
VIDRSFGVWPIDAIAGQDAACGMRHSQCWPLGRTGHCGQSTPGFLGCTRLIVAGGEVKLTEDIAARQDRSEWQMEWQNRACVSYSAASGRLP